SDENAARLSAAELQHSGRNEAVVENDVRGLQLTHRLQRQEFRIAWARPYNDYFADGRGHLLRQNRLRQVFQYDEPCILVGLRNESDIHELLPEHAASC